MIAIASTEAGRITTALALIGSAFSLWLYTLPRIPFWETNDYGLVSVLPVTFYAAVGLLMLSFALVVGRPQTPTALLALHVVALIVIIHATPAMLYDVPRYAWTYKHVGVAEYIQRNGSIDPTIDIYFNWPGFFAFNALFTTVANLDSALGYAGWAPLFFNLLYLTTLLLLFGALTTDRRLVWLSVWFFYLTSWVGQDYFAPQALAYFCHVTLLGICLRYLRPAFPFSREMPKPRRVPHRIWRLICWVAATGQHDDRPALDQRPVVYVAAVLLTMACFGYIVTSHQLTPFMTIAAVTALVVCGCCRARSLPLLMALLTTIWVVYVAAAYTDDKLAWIIRSIGQLGDHVSENLTNLNQKTAGRTFVAMACRVFTASIWALAAIGAVRRRRIGYNDLAGALIGFAPFTMLLLQSYGGEMLFRIFFFSLPGMIFLVATLVYPRNSANPPRGSVLLVALLSACMFCGFLFAYYGNERMNMFTRSELEAIRTIDAVAPDGAAMMSITGNVPRRFERYDAFSVSPISDGWDYADDDRPHLDIDAVVELMRDPQYPAAYLVLSRGQEAHIELMSMLAPGEYRRFVAAALVDPRLKPFYSADSVVVLVPAEQEESPR